MIKYKELLFAACLLYSFESAFCQEDKRIFINLGENVNTKSVEINPHISADGKKLYFVRESGSNDEQIFQDIYVSELGEDGKWKQAVALSKPLNQSPSNSIVSVSADGNQLLIKGFYKKGSYKGNGYSITRKSSKGWSTPEGFVIEGYSDIDKGKFNNACLSDDGRVLIFSLCGEQDGMDNDLLISFKKEDGTFSRPTKLHGNVNKPVSMEFAPFLASDNKTLYFSSNREGGLGETDIYKTERLDNTWLNWSDPKNLGEKINGPGKESYYTLDAKGSHAYMVSNKNAIGLVDIVMVELEEAHKPKPVALIKGNIFDAKTKKPIDARIEFHEFPTDSLHGETHTNGAYSITFPIGESYVLTAHAHGYVTSFDTLSLTNAVGYIEVQKDYYLTPIIKGEKVVLKHVNFETNSSVLFNESFVELDKVAQFLKENEEVKILIGGHTDNTGNKESNRKLSDDRAKAVMDYLLSKGVGANRVQSKGFGDSQPIVPNDTDEHKHMNRRVEFVITEE